MSTTHPPLEEQTLLAFHAEDGWKQSITGREDFQTPTTVYEVIERVKVDGSRLYEGRIFDAATKEMLHRLPYQSTFLDAFATWWRNQTSLPPPEELLTYRGTAHD